MQQLAANPSEPRPDPTAPPDRYLLAEEEPDTVWRREFYGRDDDEGGRYYLYMVGLGGASLLTVRADPSFRYTRGLSYELAPENWPEVPEDVPRTLLDTVEWVKRAGATRD